MKTNITPDLIRSTLQFIPASLSLNDWAHVGMAIKSEFPDATGLDLFNEWSTTAPGYDLRATRSTWHSLKAGGGVGIGPLLRLAQQRGFTLAKAKDIVAQKEKRDVSFHEAGHAAICLRFGGTGVARIWRNTPENVKAGQNTWLGNFVMFAEPGTVAMDDVLRQLLDVKPAPENWRALLGMAGLVTEQISNGITDAVEIYCSIKALISFEQVSRTDLDLMGDWQFSDVVDAVALLVERWPDVERRAGWLESSWAGT